EALRRPEAELVPLRRERSTPAAPTRPRAPRPGLFSELAPAARRPALLAPGQAGAAAGLGGGAPRVPGRQALKEHGLDSLMAVELRNRLAALWGVRLPIGAIFESPAALVAALLRTVPEEKKEDELPPLQPDPEARPLPFALTPIQQAYWLGRGSLFALGGVSAHGYLEIELRGLDVARLERILHRLIARHGMLRVVIDADGQQRQLAAVPHFRIAVAEHAQLPPAQQQAAAQRLRDEMSQRVLPADRWPLFELCACRLADDVVRLHLGLDLLI